MFRDEGHPENEYLGPADTDKVKEEGGKEGSEEDFADGTKGLHGGTDRAPADLKGLLADGFSVGAKDTDGPLDCDVGVFGSDSFDGANESFAYRLGLVSGSWVRRHREVEG